MATRQGVPLERTVGRKSDLGEGSAKELCTFHFADGVLVLLSSESLEQGWSSVPKKVVASVCPQGRLRGTLCSCTLILGSKGAETTPWRNWAPTQGCIPPPAVYQPGVRQGQGPQMGGSNLFPLGLWYLSKTSAWKVTEGGHSLPCCLFYLHCHVPAT